MSRLTPPSDTPFFGHLYEQHIAPMLQNFIPLRPSRCSFIYLPFIDIISEEITLIKSAEVYDHRQSKLNAYMKGLMGGNVSKIDKSLC